MCTGAFPLACIYHRLSHKRQEPRFFAGTTIFLPTIARNYVRWAASAMELMTIKRENQTTALRAWKCTPSAACGGVCSTGKRLT